MKAPACWKGGTKLLSLALCICFTAGIGLPAVGEEAQEDPVPEGLARVKTLLKEVKYAEAESLARSLLKDAEARYGAESAEAAGVLEVLVASLVRGGKAREEETLRLAQRALVIRESVHGSHSQPVASAIIYLGIVHYYRGDLQKTRPLWERALAIREKALGPDHPKVAVSLNNLANLLKELGDYEAARPLYERSLAILEKALGPDHPHVAGSLNNLAILLGNLGDYEAARPLHQRALAIREKALGPDHPEVAGSLNNLANLLKELGDYEAARPLYERALAIREKALGPDHPEVAGSLNNLANLLWNLGDYEAARPLHERSLAIYEKALGPDHPDVARSLSNLANLLRDLGDYEAARPLHERSLAIRGKALGPDHPKVAVSLNSLARLLLDQGEEEQAIEASLRAEEISREHLRATSGSLAEREALRYAATRVRGLNVALTIAAGAEASKRWRVWEAGLRSRALVLDEMAGRRRAVLASSEPEVARLRQELDSARRRLVHLTVRGLGDEEPAVYRRLLEGARNAKEAAERALARASVEFRRQQELEQAGLEEVRGMLPEDTALVGFFRYLRHPVAVKEGQAPPEPVASYLAFVLPAGGGEIQVVSLGAARTIDEQVASWAREAGSPHGGEADLRRAGASLRRRIWDPLAEHLEGAEKVLLVPDGALHLVNFAALPVEGGRYLVEEGPLLHVLSAERDLVALAQRSRPGKGLVAVGGPDFEERSLFAALRKDHQETDADEPVARLAQAASYRATRSTRDDFRSLVFAPLPGALREAREVSGLWKRYATEPEDDLRFPLLGEEASETAFRDLATGKRVLHLATHGFYLGGNGEATRGTRGVAGVRPLGAKSPSAPEPPITAFENPLLHSGLALAGANHRRHAGPGEDDGILTAEEIAALDLRGVEWAVLSACETGLGEVQAGEGVLGLRRAFRVAGARTLIMSLWPVEDQATREWMKALYRARLRDGKSTAEAVREASLEILERRRRKGRSTHPFAWGAFIASGDWR